MIGKRRGGRTSSLYEDDKLLSMSLRESEEVMREWREHNEHRVAQELGKAKYFHACQIRVVRQGGRAGRVKYHSVLSNLQAGVRT